MPTDVFARAYPHQVKEVEWLTARPSRTGLILSDAGLGKSVTSLLCQHRLGVRKHLVITPSGLGRLTAAWADRLREWGPADVSWALIDEGPRAADSEPAKWRKAMKLTADTLIVTPDLLKHVPQTGWEQITVDEIHEYVSAKSAAAQAIRSLVQKNLQAARLGLTATPMTADPLSTWVVLDMLWPGSFGRALPTGKPPWAWQKKWGYEHRNEHGVVYSGLREEVREEFKQFLAQFSVRTLREDLGNILPRVDIRAVTVDHKKPLLEHAVAILDTISRETTHVAAYCHNIAPAEELFARLSSLPRYRQHQLLLVHSERQVLPPGGINYNKPSVLVATIGAVGRGISLSYIGQYVVWQPTKTAHELIQLDGRHVRLDRPNAPPAIGHLFFREGEDEGIRAVLTERLDAFTEGMRSGENVAGLRAAVQQGRQSFEDRLRSVGRSFRFVDVDDDEEEDGLF